MVLTIPWINHRGSVPTTGLQGLMQAIDMAGRNEVLNRVLLAYIYFGVNQLYQQSAMRPATPTLETTILIAVALTLAPTGGCLQQRVPPHLRRPRILVRPHADRRMRLRLWTTRCGPRIRQLRRYLVKPWVRRRSAARRVINRRLKLGRLRRRPATKPDRTPHSYSP